MGNKFYFSGSIEAEIKDGLWDIPLREEVFVLGMGTYSFHIPLKVAAFPIPWGKYILKEDNSDGYNHLSIFPEDMWHKYLLHEEHINESLADDFVANSYDLETVIGGNQNNALRLPSTSLWHLKLEEPIVKIVGLDKWFEIWNPRHFERLKLSTNLGELLDNLGKHYNI